MATALIQERGTVSGNQMRMERLNEAAAQTFLAGTPVSVTAGAVGAWNGTTTAAGIAGIAKDFGAGLATAGVPLNTQYAPSGAPFGGGGLKFGSVPNMPLANNLARPYFNDGKSGVVLAISDTLFYGQVGPAQTVSQALVGTLAGLTIDTDNHWYVDTSKNTSGTGAVVQIVQLDYWDTTRGVLFVFLPAAAQILA